MTDAATIQTILHALGIAISREEAQRLGPPLQAILTDLQKLDALESELQDPTPRFAVEERYDRE